MTTDEIPILDDRARFYLRNRADIEEWASLGSQARTSLHHYLQGLGPDIEERLAGDGSQVNVEYHDGNPRFVCWLEEWDAVNESGHPLLSVALEWTRNVTPDHPDRAPYVGVLALLSTPRGERLRRAFRDRAIETRTRQGWKHNNTWPAWKPVLADGEYWDHLDGYREQLLKELATTWEAFSGHITDAAASLDAEPEHDGLE